MAVGEYYHVFNRGVDKRDIFLDKSDFERFLLTMREFNNKEPIGGLHMLQYMKGGIDEEYGAPEPLVNIICYCLNPNHFHLVLEQIAERGVERFLQRIGTGHTKYFNARHSRSGALFQGRFKVAHITTNEYLLHVSVYVNLNDRVHQLRSPASKSSWEEYSKGIDDNHKDAMCSKKVVLSQFDHVSAYRGFAERTLPSIQARKDLQRMLF
jgi:putative transposase